MKKYYALTESEASADLYIYGDITSRPWNDSDASAYDIVEELRAITAPQINVHINSCGGEVAEGLAIFNALKCHPANVTTYCDGFACSMASVVFMAGNDRVMSEASLLMIHNAWTWTAGNAEELRKTADDVEKISDAAANAYRAAINITDKELKKLLDEETWLTPTEALDYGFATSVVALKSAAVASMSARKMVYQRMLAAKQTEQPKHEQPEEPEAPAQKTKKYFNFGGKQC